MAAPRKHRWVCGPEHEGRRLDHVLSEWLPAAVGRPVSRARTRALILAGAVYLNGKRVRIASKELRARAIVEAFVDPRKLQTEAEASDRPWSLETGDILFEDDHLIAVNKPYGLPTQPTVDEARRNLFAEVRSFLKKRDGGEGYAGLHHRLDRDTSGVVLFTKKKEANAGVAKLFAEHLARKTYWALCEVTQGAPLPDAWTVKNHLGRDRNAPGKQSRFCSVRAGGNYAETEFRVLERLGRTAWVEARPVTGRTHQIRVHLSEAGLPILGDATYGHRATAPRLMLHAACLTFPHPILSVESRIESPMPEDFLQCLQQLRPQNAKTVPKTGPKAEPTGAS
jgi:RluA family pseudouridine synthase